MEAAEADIQQHPPQVGTLSIAAMPGPREAEAVAMEAEEVVPVPLVITISNMYTATPHLNVGVYGRMKRRRPFACKCLGILTHCPSRLVAVTDRMETRK